MTRAPFTIVIAFLCSTAAAVPLVTYQSPCECLDNHGKRRWAEKNDPAPPPTDASAIQGVKPSDIFNWQGPTVTADCMVRGVVAFIGHLEMRSFGGHRCNTSWWGWLDRQILGATIFLRKPNLRSKDSRHAPACKF